VKAAAFAGLERRFADANCPDGVAQAKAPSAQSSAD